MLSFICVLTATALQWRRNGRDSVSNHQPHDCLLNRLFRRRSKKTSRLRVTGLCAGTPPGTGEFPAQMASYAENVSIWWSHHGRLANQPSLEQDLFYPIVYLYCYDHITHSCPQIKLAQSISVSKRRPCWRTIFIKFLWFVWSRFYLKVPFVFILNTHPTPFRLFSCSHIAQWKYV